MEAVTDMRLKANKDKLAELIARAEAKNTALYTAESVAVMKSALVDAQSIMQDDTLSTDDQEVVDNAARILEQAIDGLVLLSGEESPDDPDLPSSEPSSDPGSVNTGSTATFIWLIVFLTVGAGCAIFLLRRKEGQNV